MNRQKEGRKVVHLMALLLQWAKIYNRLFVWIKFWFISRREESPDKEDENYICIDWVETEEEITLEHENFGWRNLWSSWSFSSDRRKLKKKTCKYFQGRSRILQPIIILIHKWKIIWKYVTYQISFENKKQNIFFLLSMKLPKNLFHWYCSLND